MLYRRFVNGRMLEEDPQARTTPEYRNAAGNQKWSACVHGVYVVAGNFQLAQLSL